MASSARPKMAGLLALCLLSLIAVSIAAPLAGPKCKNRFPKYPLCKFVNDMATSFTPTVVDAASGKTLQISAYQIYHARAAIYLGIAANERAWRVWDLGDKCVVTSRDVVFDEDKFPSKEKPTQQLTFILPPREEVEESETPPQVEKEADGGGANNEESIDDVVEVSPTEAATTSTPSSLPLALTRERREVRPPSKYNDYATVAVGETDKEGAAFCFATKGDDEHAKSLMEPPPKDSSRACYEHNKLLDRQHMFTNDFTLMPGMAKPKMGGIPIVVHRHGGEQASDFDGHPDAWFTQFGEYGPTFKSRLYRYGNQQSASLIWFHDHALGWTRLNTVAGLAGAYIIVDPKGEEKNLQFLPQPGSGRYVPLVLADRSFFANGSIDYPNVGIVPKVHPNWVPEYFGNHILVNGVVWPYLKVRRALYRFRVLGGSNARFYNLRFTCAGRGDYPNFTPPLKGPSLEIIQIGSDGGYLAAPVRMSSLLVMPGERMDILVDFNGAPGHCKDVILTNDARAPYPAGEPADANTGVIMRFVLKKTKIPTPPIPSSLVLSSYVSSPLPTPSLPSAFASFKLFVVRLSFAFGEYGGRTADLGSSRIHPSPKQSIPRVDVASAVRSRFNTLVEIMDPATQLPIRVTIDGKMHHDPATEIAKEGTAELWNIINLSADAHAMHLHLIQHRPISRRPFDIAKYTAGKCSFKDKTKPSCYTGPAVEVNANERGWKDTTLSQPGQVLTIYTPFYQQSGVKTFKFDASRGPGYVWHCHMLEHEENDMMRPLIITK
ncbi:unnamed protein product [Closterium sp. Naga37s-1]|nr:unnamed protein product [Closterium sp. Naga37s-1]